MQIDLMRGNFDAEDVANLLVAQPESLLRPWLAVGKDFVDDRLVARHASEAFKCLGSVCTGAPAARIPPLPVAAEQLRFATGREAAGRDQLFLLLPVGPERHVPDGCLSAADARAAAVSLGLVEFNYKKAFGEPLRRLCQANLAEIQREIQARGRPGQVLTDAVASICEGVTKRSTTGHKLPGSSSAFLSGALQMPLQQRATPMVQPLLVVLVVAVEL